MIKDGRGINQQSRNLRRIMSCRGLTHLLVSLSHQVLHGVFLLKNFQEPDDLVIGPVRVPIPLVVEPVAPVSVAQGREKNRVVLEEAHPEHQANAVF